jgi:two-component system chemotaxis response regulator CheB
VGVVLSGSLDDGTAGLTAIKACGGLAIVQDPADALFAGMPSSAIENVKVDHVLTVEEIALKLDQLARSRVKRSRKPRIPDRVKLESEFTLAEHGMEEMDQWGKRAELACPTCSGSLWEIEGERMLRFRCHTGHAFSPESLLAEQSEAVEQALYSALRALREKAQLTRRMGSIYGGKFPQRWAEREAEAKRLEAAADRIRTLLVTHGKHSTGATS